LEPDDFKSSGSNSFDTLPNTGHVVFKVAVNTELLGVACFEAPNRTITRNRRSVNFVRPRTPIDGAGMVTVATQFSERVAVRTNPLLSLTRHMELPELLRMWDIEYVAVHAEFVVVYHSRAMAYRTSFRLSVVHLGMGANLCCGLAEEIGGLV